MFITKVCFYPTVKNMPGTISNCCIFFKGFSRGRGNSRRRPRPRRPRRRRPRRSAWAGWICFMFHTVIIVYMNYNLEEHLIEKTVFTELKLPRIRNRIRGSGSVSKWNESETLLSWMHGIDWLSWVHDFIDWLIHFYLDSGQNFHTGANQKLTHLYSSV